MESSLIPVMKKNRNSPKLVIFGQKPKPLAHLHFAKSTDLRPMRHALPLFTTHPNKGHPCNFRLTQQKEQYPSSMATWWVVFNSKFPWLADSQLLILSTMHPPRPLGQQSPLATVKRAATRTNENLLHMTKKCSNKIDLEQIVPDHKKPKTIKVK